MKKIFFQLFIISLFAFTNKAYSTILANFSGGELVIVETKQEGFHSFYFNIPDNFFQENGILYKPISVKITSSNGLEFQLESITSTIILPDINWQKGTYKLEITIHNYIISEKFTL